MENEKQTAVIIYDDGSYAIVGPIALGAVRVALQLLQQAIDALSIGPQPPPITELNSLEELKGLGDETE